MCSSFLRIKVMSWIYNDGDNSRSLLHTKYFRKLNSLPFSHSHFLTLIGEKNYPGKIQFILAYLALGMIKYYALAGYCDLIPRFSKSTKYRTWAVPLELIRNTDLGVSLDLFHQNQHFSEAPMQFLCIFSTI